MTQWILRGLISSLLFLVLNVLSFAQDSLYVSPVDSNKVSYIFANDFEEQEPDSTLERYPNFNPLLAHPYPLQYLGNLGSPTNQMVYESRHREGFDVGLHQYDIYLIEANDLKYYKTSKPYTNVFYSQGGAQNNAYLLAEYGHKINRTTTLGFFYRLVNQKGYYSNHRARHTNVATSARYESLNGRYQAFGNLTLNGIKQQNNGGIQNDTLLEEPLFRNRLNVPVKLGTIGNAPAKTSHLHNEIRLTQYLSFRKVAHTKTDSTDKAKVKADPRSASPLAYHELAYQWEKYKFFDTAPASDSAYYQHFQVNNRGIRNFIKDKTITNTFKFLSPRYNKNLEPTFGRYEAGLRYKLHFLHQEPETRQVHNLWAFGSWETVPDTNKVFLINAYGSYGLLQNVGDYLVHGDINFNLDKFGKLNAFILNQRYSPSLIQQKLYVSQELFWDNNFKRPIETSLGGNYTLESFDLKAGAQYHLLNNVIYYDTLAIARQFTPAINVVQLMLWKDFHFGALHIENQFVFQQTTGNVLRLPSFVSRHDVYLEGYLFKKALLSRLGLALAYNTRYFANTYHPVSGQFYLQDQKRIHNIPIADLYVSFQIKRFRGFLKGENITELIFNRTALAAPDYPLPDFVFRFGVSWNFRD